MRILLVQSSPYVPALNGASKSNRLLMEDLCDHGHYCRVLAASSEMQGLKSHAQLLGQLGARPNAASVGVESFNLKGVQVHAVGDGSQMRTSLREQIRTFDPDWVFVSSEDPGQTILEAALEADAARVVYLARTTLMLPFGPSSMYPSDMRTDLLRQAAGIMTVSHYLSDYIGKWSGIASVKMPIQLYGSGPFANVGNFDRGFVTMINPCAEKGICIFLALAERMPDVQFSAVPMWGTTAEDLSLIRHFPNIVLLEPREDIDAIFAQTRILLLPSVWAEAGARITIEAMLRGLPVIASNSGGLPEAKLGVDYLLPVNLIERYEECWTGNTTSKMIPVVPDQDISPWLKTLNRLLTDRSDYERVSAASHETAIAYVSSLGCERIETYLQSLTRPSKRPDRIVSAQDVRNPAETPIVGERLNGLSAKRRALLALRLMNKPHEASGWSEGGQTREADLLVGPRASRSRSAPPIRRVQRRGRYPLSFGQQRLWFVEQLEPGDAVYIIPAAYRATGNLSVAVLQQTIDRIVERHESLRTSFISDDGVAAQVIAPAEHLELAIIDLSGLSDEETKSQARRLAREEASTGFNLSNAPLLRVKLIRLGAENLILFTMHHIVCDAWSMGIMVSEIGELYETYVSGEQKELRPLPLQYVDYAVWQRDWLQGEVLQEQVAYWKRQLAGRPAPMELTEDRSRGREASHRGGRVGLRLGREMTDELMTLSRKEGVTLFMTMLAAFTVLLYKYTGRQDIIVGTPIAGRNRMETEGVIGFFINNLTLRTDMSGNPTFRDLLARVREVTLGAYAHQDTPFEKIIEELRPERNSADIPLIRVVLGLQNTSFKPLSLHGLTLTRMGLDLETVRYDLNLWIGTDDTGELVGSWRYNITLFAHSKIRRMSEHFKMLLLNIVARPDVRLNSLEMATEEERLQKANDEQALEEAFDRELTTRRRKVIELHSRR